MGLELDGVHSRAARGRQTDHRRNRARVTEFPDFSGSSPSANTPRRLRRARARPLSTFFPL